MAEETREQGRDRPSLKDLDAYTDRNGQDLGGTSPPDVGIPARTQKDLRSDPGGEAETARIASGLPGEDATEPTEAETPEQNLRRIGDPRAAASAASSGGGSDATSEAIERATAAVGSDEDDGAGEHDG